MPSARPTPPEAAPAHVDPNTQSRAEPTGDNAAPTELTDQERRLAFDNIQKISAGLYARYRYEPTDEARQLAFDDLNRRFDLRPGFPDEVPLAKLEEINAHLDHEMVELNRKVLADPTATEATLDLLDAMELKIVVEDEIAKYNLN